MQRQDENKKEHIKAASTRDEMEKQLLTLIKTHPKPADLVGLLGINSMKQIQATLTQSKTETAHEVKDLHTQVDQPDCFSTLVRLKLINANYTQENFINELAKAANANSEKKNDDVARDYYQYAILANIIKFKIGRIGYLSLPTDAILKDPKLLNEFLRKGLCVLPVTYHKQHITFAFLNLLLQSTKHFVLMYANQSYYAPLIYTQFFHSVTAFLDAARFWSTVLPKEIRLHFNKSLHAFELEFEFLLAVNKLDPQHLRNILQKNPSLVHTKSMNHASMSLLATITFDALDIIEVLVEFGIDVNELLPSAKNQITPLTLACTLQRTNIVRYLLENGAKVNNLNAQGQTALEEFILKIADDIRSGLYNRSIQAERIKESDRAILMLLLKADANYHTGMLQALLVMKRPDLLFIFKKHVRQLDKKDSRLITKTISESDFNPEDFDEESKAVVTAAPKSKIQVNRELIAEARYRGLELLKAQKYSESEQAFTKAAQLQGKVLARNPLAVFQWIPTIDQLMFFRASIEGDIAQALKVWRSLPNDKRNSVVRMQMPDGTTPLMVTSDFKFFQFLIEECRVGLIYRDERDQTFLHHHATKAHLDILGLLSSKRKPDLKKVLNYQDIDGNTALHLVASKSEFAKFAEALISLGIHLSLKNSQGETAFDIAVRNKNEGVIQAIHDVDIVPSVKEDADEEKFEDQSFDQEPRALTFIDKGFKEIIDGKYLANNDFMKLVAKMIPVEAVLRKQHEKHQTIRSGLRLANFLRLSKKITDERDILDKLVATYSDNLKVKMASGLNHLRLGNLEKAEQELDYAYGLAVDQKEIRLGSKIGSALYKIYRIGHRTDEAYALLEAAISNKTADVFLQLKWLAMNNKQYGYHKSLILNQYRKLLQQHTTSSAIIIRDRAWYYIKCADYQTALTEFKSLEKINPIEYLKGAAVCYEALSNHDEASFCYKVLQTDYADIFIGRLRAAMYFSKQKDLSLEVKIEHFEKLIKDFPSYEDANLAFAVFQSKQQNTREATIQFERSCQRFPLRVRCHLEFINYYLVHGQHDNAIDLSNSIIENMADYPEVHLASVRSYLSAKKYDKAMQAADNFKSKHYKDTVLHAKTLRSINELLKVHRAGPVAVNLDLATDAVEVEAKDVALPSQQIANKDFPPFAEEKHLAIESDMTFSQTNATPDNKSSLIVPSNHPSSEIHASPQQHIRLSADLGALLMSFYQAGFLSAIDGRSTLELQLLPHRMDTDCVLQNVYSNATPEALTISGALHLADNKWQVIFNKTIIHFHLYPELHDQKALNDKAAMSSLFSIFTIVADHTGKLYSGEKAKVAQQSAKLSFRIKPDEHRKNVDNFFLKRPINLLIAVFDSVNYRLKIDDQVKQEFKTFVSTIIGSTDTDSTAPQRTKLSFHELYEFLCYYFTNPEKTADLCEALVKYNLDQLIVPGNVSIHEWVILMLRTQKTNGQTSLDRLYFYMAIYQNYENYGKHDFLSKIEASLCRFGLAPNAFDLWKL
ncbi:MAG: ankyrin repeat domain-containing protein [Gammaproteobacteria bacterium]